MKCSLFALSALSFLAVACGSSDDQGGPASGHENSIEDGYESEAERVGKFDPPPPAEGYERHMAASVTDIQPGDDVTYCQYVTNGLDRDVDVIDVGGYQSAYGHHAVAFSYTDTGAQTIGEAFPCMGSEVSSGIDESSGGAFLGGPAGEKILPEGVAFRLKKGSGIMLNVHYINTGNVPIDGDAVVDVKLAEVDPSRRIAAMFLNLNLGFVLPPSSPAESTVECTVGSDVNLIVMSNHMHEFGKSVTTELIRADGAVEMMHHDPDWTYEMQFNIVATRWPAETPFVLRTGDTLRTTCKWENSTAEELSFPREMCIGVGFALTTGDKPSAPACVNGTWFSELL